MNEENGKNIARRNIALAYALVAISFALTLSTPTFNLGGDSKFIITSLAGFGGIPAAVLIVIDFYRAKHKPRLSEAERIGLDEAWNNLPFGVHLNLIGSIILILSSIFILIGSQ